MTYRKWNTVPQKVITSKELKDSMPLSVRLKNFIITSDNKYWVTDWLQYVSIALEAKRLCHPYVKDRFDCDDYSSVLYCYSRYEYGINGIGKHCYDLCVTMDGKCYIIESETGDIIRIEDRNRSMYSLTFALIIF